jgi:hypothetical protein
MWRYLTVSGKGLRDHHDTVLSDAEFERQFGTDEACRDFLFRHRWPAGFECTWCGSSSFQWLGTRRLLCLSCRKTTWLTAGTILHRTKKPLTLWFKAAFLIVQHGTSARMLQQRLGLTYKVAWAWAHRLRRLMEVKSMLDVPSKAFPGKWQPPKRCQWNSMYGMFEWEAVLPAMSVCCARFESADWNDRGHDCMFAKQYLFSTTSGSLGVKHLDHYLRMMEFRTNFRETPIGGRAEIVMGRFAVAGPLPYREIRGEPRPRNPIHMIWRQPA